MVLTAKQQEGLKLAVARYKAKEKYTCISGFAGSGKSTLVKFIIEALKLNPEEDVCYVAYTGKASTVLRQMGCPNAVTAHKLLYWARPTQNGTYVFTPKTSLEEPYKVIVVDEVSMLPKTMWDLLMRHPVYVIALGDPGQIPPVDKTEENHILDNPHVFLDEIMRQAQDSEIIRLSMWIREGKPLDTFPCANEQVQVVSPNEVVDGMYDWADQIICATNAKRVEINNFVRARKGFGVEPQIGDKVIGLTNHWDFLSQSGDWALTNGSIGIIKNFTKQSFYVPRYITTDSIQYMFTDIELEDGDCFNATPIDYIALRDGVSPLSSRQRFQLNANKQTLDAPYDFTYAYGITGHKAQGSQWQKVLAYEERFPFKAEEHTRWLYTVATRASEKLVMVKEN